MRAAIPLLIALAGCTAGKGNNSWPTDTLPPVRLAESLSAIPEVAYIFNLLVVAFTNPDDPSACPTVTLDGDNYAAEGGCTDGTGNVYGGSITIVSDDTSAVETYDDWSIEGADFSWVMNGALTLASSGDDVGLLSEEDFHLVATGLDPAVYGQEEADATFPGFASHLPLDADGNLDVFSGTGSPDFAGAIIEETQGTATLSGGYNLDTETCPDEPTSGTLTINGDGTASITYDGSSACDGCATYALSDGSTETACAG